jgi:predicted AlkP superfamily pyrophosphatase or phosphodiesterase
MKNPFRHTFTLLVVVLAACSTQHQSSSSRNQYAPLILISIDGFRADYLDRGFTPTLRALAGDGVQARALRPVFPTLTFPNHYTLVTGLYPDHHGIVDNTMRDAMLGNFSIGNREAGSDGRWWDGGEPVWVTADKQGLRSATMFWPGSEAQIHGYRPDYRRPFDGKLEADQRVDQVLDWLDLPADQRPQFVTLYFNRVDGKGHDYGPDSSQVNEALHSTDAAIGSLVEQLKLRNLYRSTNLIIVSDHGMTAVDDSRVILLDDLIDLKSVDLITTDAVAGIDPKPGHEADIEKALVTPHEHMQCWRKAEIPKRLHYGSNPRIPALICIADDGWMIETQAALDRPNRHAMRGEHGYDNADPRMGALFIAHGPAFKRALVVPEFDNVNVYPLITHILGIKAAVNDGDLRVTQGMLR